MNKMVLTALAAFIAIAGASCSTKDKEKDSEIKELSRDIKFESYTYDIISEFTGNDTLEAPGGKLVRFIGQGILPEDIGDTDIKTLRETLMNIAGIHFIDGNAEPIMTDSLKVTDIAASDTDACGEVISTLATTLVTPRAIVWENIKYVYPCLAAHGNTNTTYVNFCLTDGKIISLGDLFKPDYQKPLMEMIRTKLKESGHELLMPINEVSFPSQFGLTSKGIIFSYDPYQIAPYSEGTIQIELSAGELSDILSQHGLYVLLGII